MHVDLGVQLPKPWAGAGVGPLKKGSGGEQAMPWVWSVLSASGVLLEDSICPPWRPLSVLPGGHTEQPPRLDALGQGLVVSAGPCMGAPTPCDLRDQRAQPWLPPFLSLQKSRSPTIQKQNTGTFREQVAKAQATHVITAGSELGWWPLGPSMHPNSGRLDIAQKVKSGADQGPTQQGASP